MSVVVLAYHEMGCRGLRVLLERGTPVSALFTYEDSPSENCWFGSVADLAREAGIPVFTTERINDPAWVDRIRSLAPDVLFSFYYRHIIKAAIRRIPRRGCINMHGSLLPKYRGRCPLNWQLVHGETESGVTLHHIVGRADAGDIIGQERVPVGPNDTAMDLCRALLPAAETLLHRHLDAILDGSAPRTPQDDDAATVFGGRCPEDGRIDWAWPAQRIHNLVRAVGRPWPGAFSDGPAGRLMVWRTRVLSAGDLAPGRVRVDEDRVLAGTGDGLIELLDTTPGPLRDGDVLAAGPQETP